MQADRVVPVIRGVGDQRRVGSGYWVADRFVLTAAHCVRGSRHRVWLPDGERDVRVVVDGSPVDIDLALLEITPSSDQAPVRAVPPTPCGRVDRRIPGRIGECISVGYPRHAAYPGALFTTAEVDGWIPAGSGFADSETGRTERFLTLRAEGTPPRPLPSKQDRLSKSQWAGMSGAAVFAGSLLVGVVAEHHLPEGDGSLTVVPITWADQLPDADRACLLLALGVPSVSAMQVLAAGTAARRWAGVLPDRPTVLVERPRMLAAIRQALLASAGKPVLVTGMGGAGKSVLAAQLARAVRDGADAELAAEYPAGVAWAAVGRERPTAAVQLELARAFGEEKPDVSGDWRSGRARLDQLTAGRRGLLVLDDVWTQDRYEPFRLPASQAHILITTRNQALADAVDGVLVPAGELEKDQSRELLAAWAGLPPEALPAEAGDLLSLVGDLALGVAMVGAIVRARGLRAWPGLLHRLRGRQLDKIAHKFSDNYEHATILRAIEVAVEDLDAADQRRWAELAVFTGQGRIPEAAIAALWYPYDSDDLDTADRIARFQERSLLQASGDGRYGMHDLQYDVAALRLGTEAPSSEDVLADAHAQLVDSYAERVAAAIGLTPKANWAELTGALARKSAADAAWQVADDGYLLGHLIAHLRRCGRRDVTAALLGGYDWITVGVTRRGLAALAVDYDALQAGDPLRMMRYALGHSARAVAADPRCLPDQLLGRLGDAEEPALAPLVARLRAEQANRPIQIIRSGLQPASTPLINVLSGHQGQVRAVAVTRDSTRVVTAGFDATAIVWDLATGTVLHTLTGHAGELTTVAVTADGTRAVTGGRDRTAIVWDLATGAALHALTGHQDWVTHVAVTLDGAWAVTVSDDGTAIVWDLATGTALHTLTGHRNSVNAVAVTNDGARAVTVSDDGTAIVWDLATGTALHTLTGHQDSVKAVALTGDGARAVTTSNDTTAIVWDLASGTALHTLAGHQRGLYEVVITVDGTRAVTTSLDRTAMVWDLATGMLLHTLTGHDADVFSVAVTVDGTRAITGSHDHNAIVWDLATGRALNILTRHRLWINAVAVTADGTRAVTASADDSAIVWDISAGLPRHTPASGHQKWIKAVAVTSDGARAVTASADDTAIVWDLASGTALHTLAGHRDSVQAVAVSGDGTRAVTASQDHTAIVWDLASGTPLHALTGHQSFVNAVAVTGDGTRAVTGSLDRTAIVWDLATGTALHALTGHQDSVEAVAVTSDGARAVTASQDHTAIVWDLATGTALHTLAGHRRALYSVAITSNGATAITTSEDPTAIVWDLATGTVLHTLVGHKDSIRKVTITSDDSRAITTSADRTALVWDLATGTRCQSLIGHQRPIQGVAVTSDNRWAITASDDWTVNVWNLSTGQRTATWRGDDAMLVAAWAPGQPIFVVGDYRGGVYILRLRASAQ
jgi:WD40 repeat protein